MNNLRLQNYRCFEDTGDIDIRPITLFIGANSSGKSSVLKFFPLLKQTIGNFVNGLYLWTGPLVDLKDFKNTLRDGSEEMSISFTIEQLPVESRIRSEVERINDVHIETVLCNFPENKHYDYIKRLTITFDGHTFSLERMDESNMLFSVDNVNSTNLKDTIFLGPTNSLLPKVIFKINDSEVSDESVSAYKRMRGLLNGENRIPYLRTIIRTNDNVFDDKSLKEYLQKSDSPVIDADKIDLFVNYLHYYTINRLIDSINLYLMDLAKYTTYVKPLRAIVERYYRFTNQAVDEIESDGSNLPMFYNSLNGKTFGEFNAWLNTLFNFIVRLKTSEGHVELQIVEKDKPVRNLVDVGFGYTQILPIITIIWKKIYMDAKSWSRNKCKSAIVAIEQPELHLHPRFQGLFAQMLAAVVADCKKKGIDLRLVIESHSEIIVNKLGELIASEESPLRKDDVNVLIFNSPQDNLKKEIIESHYDKDGVLNNWPYGFFSDYVR